MAKHAGTAWQKQLFDFTVANGAQATPLDLLPEWSPPELRNCTVIRIIGRFFMAIETEGTNDNWQAIDFGIGVSGADAFAAGAVSLPNPLLEIERPPRGWVWTDR